MTELGLKSTTALYTPQRFHVINVNSFAFVIPLLVVGYLAVWVLCRGSSVSVVTEEKMSGHEAFIPIVLVIAITLSLWLLDSTGANPFAYFPDEISMIGSSTVLILAPTLCVVWASRKSLRTVRLTFAHIKLSAALGVIVSLILLIPTVIYSPLFVMILRAGAIDIPSQLSFAYNAFCEELLFRGLLQTRLERFFGPRVGLILTAIMFDLYHAPILLLVNNLTPTSFAATEVLALPFMLLLGYVAQKSNNILGSTIFHIAYNLPVLLFV